MHVAVSMSFHVKNCRCSDAIICLLGLLSVHIWGGFPFFAIPNNAAVRLVTSLLVDTESSFIWGLMSVSRIGEFKEGVDAWALMTFKFI